MRGTLRRRCHEASPIRCAGVCLRAPRLAIARRPDACAAASVTIEKLVSDGWEVAGYISAWENRSLILFKHKEHKHLVQCSVLIDVMRNPRVVTYCYELR